MKDSCKASAIFTFADLAVEASERPAKFVTSFSKPKVEQEPAPQVNIEDETRKIFEDAYAQGEKAGFEMGMRRAESISRRLKKYVREAVLFKKTLNDKYEKLCLDLALIFGEAIVFRECDERKDVLMEMIRKALSACDEKGEIVIRVRPGDVRFVEESSGPYVKVFGDETLKEPGFIIETNLGDIDGRVSVQIQELKNALMVNHAE